MLEDHCEKFDIDFRIYGWNTSLPTRSYHCCVSNITLYVYTTTGLLYTRSIKPPPPWVLIHSRYAMSTDRFDLTGCSLVDNLQHIYHPFGKVHENMEFFGLANKSCTAQVDNYVALPLRLATMSFCRSGWRLSRSIAQVGDYIALPLRLANKSCTAQVGNYVALPLRLVTKSVRPDFRIYIGWTISIPSFISIMQHLVWFNHVICYVLFVTNKLSLLTNSTKL